MHHFDVYSETLALTLIGYLGKFEHLAPSCHREREAAGYAVARAPTLTGREYGGIASCVVEIGYFILHKVGVGASDRVRFRVGIGATGLGLGVGV